MDHDSPIYTLKNECQDCYKCVRNCPAKAIKVLDGNASVMPELCVACGVCLRVCPAGAKKIRQDHARAQRLIATRAAVYVSLAPSWANKYGPEAKGRLIAAFKRLGFAGVGETALGAQVVSAAAGQAIAAAKSGVFISSACPAAVEFVNKFIPAYRGCVLPLLSPAQAHARLLRQAFGPDIGVVFVGPCAAKKKEADRSPQHMELALTFDELDVWLEASGVSLAHLVPDPGGFVPEEAEEGRVYPVEGGMVDTLRRGGADDDVVYLTLSGLDRVRGALEDSSPAAVTGKVFIELLACENGCVNGPGMNRPTERIEDMLRLARERALLRRNSLDRPVPVDCAEPPSPRPPELPAPSPEQLRQALARIGKRQESDKLNCGGCGYQSCEAFATAMLAGKAEPSMCVSYMRRLAQRKANALLKYLPAGVVILDHELRIIECNLCFAKLFDESTRLAYDACPGLEGADIRKIVPFSELFQIAMDSGADIRRENFVCEDKIFDINIFSIEKNAVTGAIIQDVTSSELYREHIAEKAREVIQKNISAMQTIANCLGEHMADTEILLREVAKGWETDKPRMTP